jgi:hypothetical protein
MSDLEVKNPKHNISNKYLCGTKTTTMTVQAESREHYKVMKSTQTTSKLPRTCKKVQSGERRNSKFLSDGNQIPSAMMSQLQNAIDCCTNIYTPYLFIQYARSHQVNGTTFIQGDSEY